MIEPIIPVVFFASVSYSTFLAVSENIYFLFYIIYIKITGWVKRLFIVSESGAEKVRPGVEDERRKTDPVGDHEAPNVDK